MGYSYLRTMVCLLALLVVHVCRSEEESVDSSVANAGLVVEETMESESITGKTLTKYKGDRVRCDYTMSFVGAISVVIDLRKKEIVSMLHDRKEVAKISLAAQRKSVETQLKAEGIDMKKVKPPKATGKKEKVGQWEAEIFETTIGKKKARFWVVKDFPNYRALQARMAKFEAAGDFNPNQFDLGGFVVKSDFDVPPLGKTTVTLVRIAEEEVKDQEFVVPRDYEVGATNGE